MTTADWSGGEAIEHSLSRTQRSGSRWGVRRVRPDGSVQFFGRRFVQIGAQVRPEPGEWLMFYDYGERDPTPVCVEWTAPPDPDGFIRRQRWTYEPTKGSVQP